MLKDMGTTSRALQFRGAAVKVNGALDAVNIEGEVSPAAPIDIEAEVERLAKLKILEYERIRKAEAQRLGIERLSALDEAVKQKSAELAKDREDREAQRDISEPLEPWPDQVNGSDLLLTLTEALQAHVVLPEHADLAIALWILHAHACQNCLSWGECLCFSCRRFCCSRQCYLLRRSPHIISMTAPVASGGSEFAGWAFHPLESPAFARRTPITDVECIFANRRD